MRGPLRITVRGSSTAGPPAAGLGYQSSRHSEKQAPANFTFYIRRENRAADAYHAHGRRNNVRQGPINSDLASQLSDGAFK